MLDDDGWLRVTGRLSDIIIRAGENISASEVEAVLEAHPSVRHAVAVAVPDPDVGERVAAFVETSGPFDLAACRAWFAERGVTRFKTPEFVVPLDALPVLAAGKPDRAALRAMAAGAYRWIVRSGPDGGEEFVGRHRPGGPSEPCRLVGRASQDLVRRRGHTVQATEKRDLAVQVVGFDATRTPFEALPRRPAGPGAPPMSPARMRSPRRAAKSSSET